MLHVKKKGYSLLEILLAVAIVGILAGVSTPVYQAFQVRNDLDIATNSVANSMRRAQILSQSVSGDEKWGVNMQSGNATVFQGVSYAGRDTDFDEVFDIPTSISFSGVGEVVFAKLSGLPETTGIITLTSNTNESRMITINEKGMINY